ncbi:hypothetical protein [Mesorhizobium sp.]|uniref:hypothetical protein n=1 Tax=Mesorhizobium sp. TaxID=1871066 RepID=UPI000FE42BFC|nr:hypothetical protein [Mesorhizobium sp.]RWA60787.1 MAG: hypothetical protein EOQ28_32115 [Mesorhizobium sp.]RWB93906.1 MAG: hypothetical protein EOQ57_33090 [Mesorhizobium sp.]RWG77050.1 MAG: hypothetical protein EOQ69_30145 [Mesorhizobium sp.]RWG78018.1 MAG: hypothetical protein EOQ70_31395 [Mesorhizobium sp.]RWJ97047.1 MAG: hypothetical protein EOR42_29220 [Mesorhizobium sp.]
MGFPFLEPGAAEPLRLFVLMQFRMENRCALFLELPGWTTITHAADFGCINSGGVLSRAA